MFTFMMYLFFNHYVATKYATPEAFEELGKKLAKHDEDTINEQIRMVAVFVFSMIVAVTLDSMFLVKLFT